MPSPDGKGYIFTENDAPKGGEVTALATFLWKGKGKGKGKGAGDADTKAAKADPEFVELAKGAGLTPEDAVKLTRLFR